MDPAWSAQEQEEIWDLTSRFGKAIEATGYQVILVPVTDGDLDNFLSSYDPLKNIIFNWCENIPGIDHSEWLVAKYLEKKEFIFTGASSAALASAQDKFRTKQILDKSGILTPRWQIYNHTSTATWDSFPAIVKPSREHCSEGIDRNAVVTTEAELKKRISFIIDKFRQPALVEDFIDGREIHISIWGNGEIKTLPPAEMEFSYFNDEHDRICSYESKFVPESVQYQKINTVLPAQLSEDELYEIEFVCKAAYMATGCRDYARIDIRIKDNQIYVIDINPNADISPDTSTVSAAEYAGYTYGEFGAHIVNCAAQRHPAFVEEKTIELPVVATRSRRK